MIQAVRGTKDILPDTITQWQFIENTFRSVSSKYGYQEIRTPIFEKTELFSRGIGETTDVVNKEMYTFTDRGGDSITLRPEMTAGLVRAVLQNSLLQQFSTLKLWYYGPAFRYERPQKGRLRQFHQYGAECIGSDNPESDAEVILLANSLFHGAGIKEYKLLINTLGSNENRANYRAELIRFLSSNKNKLSFDSQNRLEYNPLRVLDSKEEQDIETLKGGPIILDYLDSESRVHFETVQNLLKSSAIEFEIQPMLVRGLDYYNHTVFEFQSSALGAQDSFGGGGRYNYLFEQLGGKPTPATGFALGIERILLILEQTCAFKETDTNPDVFIVSAGGSIIENVQHIAELLRKKNLKVVYDLQRRSVKAQFREANKLNAGYVIIIGEEELKRNTATIKVMATGEQKELPFDEIESFHF